MNILVTGGAGYIGSHAVRRLLADGHRLVVVDDYRHGHAELLRAACAEHPGHAAILPVDIADSRVSTASLPMPGHGSSG